MALDSSFIHLDHVDDDFVVVNDNMEVGESKLACMEKVVSEQDAALQMCQSEVNCLRDEVWMKNTTLMQKEAIIAELQESIAQLHTEMAKKTMTLQWLEQQVSKNNSDLAEKDAILAEKDALLAEKDKALAKMDAKLAESDEKDALLVEMVEKLLVEKDALLVENNALLVEKDACLAEKNKALAEKDEKLAQECKKRDLELLAQRTFDIVRLESMVEIGKKSLAEKDGHLAEKDKQISCLQAGLYAKTRALVQSQSQVRSLQVQIATMALTVVQESPNSRSLAVQNYSRASLVRKVSETSLLPKTNKALKIMVGFPLALALANAPSISSLAQCTFRMKHHDYGSRFVCNSLNEGSTGTKALLNTDANSGGLLCRDPIAAELCFSETTVAPKSMRVQDEPTSRAIVTTLDKSGHAMGKKNLPTFRILSNDHVKGEKARGRYFNFEVADVEQILGRRLAKHGERIPLLHLESGKIAMAVVWRTANGGSCGDGHGRWDDGSKLALFNVMDEMAVLMTNLEEIS
jgi:hypothetical protein